MTIANFSSAFKVYSSHYKIRYFSMSSVECQKSHKAAAESTSKAPPEVPDGKLRAASATARVARDAPLECEAHAYGQHVGMSTCTLTFEQLVSFIFVSAHACMLMRVWGGCAYGWVWLLM